MIVFLGGLLLGLLAAAQVTRKHGEPIWVIVVGAALALTIASAPLAFLFTVGPLRRKAKQIADLVQCYAIHARSENGTFNYELELPLGEPPDAFLRNSEAYVRETFAVRKLHSRADGTGFTAELGPFIGTFRHRLDVSVDTKPDGEQVARLATKLLNRMRVTPPVDAGGAQ